MGFSHALCVCCFFFSLAMFYESSSNRSAEGLGASQPGMVVRLVDRLPVCLKRNATLLGDGRRRWIISEYITPYVVERLGLRRHSKKGTLYVRMWLCRGGRPISLYD